MHRTGADDHSARRRHRIHGWRDSALRPLGGDQHGEAGAPVRDRIRHAAGTHGAFADDRRRRGRGYPARDERRRGRRLRVRGRSDFRRRLVHRRQCRRERRRQESRAVGDRPRQSGVVENGDARRGVARSHPPRPQPGQDPRRRRGNVRACLVRPRRQDRDAPSDLGNARGLVPQGGPRQGRHRQVPRRASGHPEGRLRRAHHQRPFRGAPDATGGAHRMSRVLRPGARFDAGHRRGEAVPRYAPARCGARRARTSGRALREGGRLRDQGEAPRPSEDGTDRRHRGRHRRGRREGRLRGGPDLQRARRRRIRRGLRGRTQEVLGRALPHRGDRQAHECIQDQRGRRHPAPPARRLYRRDRANQYRGVDSQQAQTVRRVGGILRRPAADPACRRGAARSGARRRQGGRGARAYPRSARAMGGSARPDRHHVPRPAGPFGRRVLEEGAEGSAGGNLRRPRVRARPCAVLCDSPGSPPQPRLRRAAHACRGRQRPHQSAGELRRLRDAAGGERGGGQDHGARAQPRRRRIRRARDRHHQARIPDAGGNRALRRLQAPRRSGGSFQRRQAASGRRPFQRLHPQLFAARRGKPDPRAERDRPHRGLRQGLPALRQVQAGLLDARTARQPALQPAQQDSGNLAADRGVPLRGADAPRGQPAPFRRVRRCRGTLHRVPQVPESVPGGHRLRRRFDRDAQPAAQTGAQALQRRGRPPRCFSSTRRIPPRSS